ncbi:MAG: 3-deoxy-7-phosphoheptulonate synthase [Spirochaetales bacterium]|jgi:3-deoxy-7-phosphoheptulonate synthase|nr:3-deoxy-7-phosphoheptulonate synthase [Spirochaetales bacterium]
MVIVLHHGIRQEEKESIKDFLQSRGFQIREIVGEEETILGAVGLVPMDIREVELMPGVDRVIPITKPYKLASREFKKDDTVVQIGPIKIGGMRIAVIAGPCAVESLDQIRETARIVKESGAVMLRGGAFKPRTSPYAFQGLGEEGLKMLRMAGEAEGMPVVSEIVGTDYADMMSDYVDAFQIGARNMQNFELLKRVGAIGKPVILKRGFAATIEDWLMAAEYLLAHGTDQIILCERGIRTFETYTRNTLDISAIPVVKQLSHLPVIVDPSHATGIRDKVPPMALASIAAGADGLLLEVHPDPEKAASDGPQSLYPEQFEKLMRDIEVLSPVVEKEVARLPSAAQGSRVSGKKETDGTGGIAFQGEPGAFSEIAIKRFFQEDGVEPVPCGSFRDVFESVLSGKTRIGVLPMENSLAGSIYENYDLLLQYPDLHIIGEKKIRIIHNLIGFPGTKIDEITSVYSHPQGLAQCSRFLDNYPDIKRVPFYDTAGSVAYIAREQKRDCAAIASTEAARTYRLQVLKEGIETNPKNYTRFFAIAPTEVPGDSDADMASIVFSTPDKPGALFVCLQILAEEKLNMKKLESRPIAGKPWEYMFYIDMELPEDTDRFDTALIRFRDAADDFRILGKYKSAH